MNTKMLNKAVASLRLLLSKDESQLVCDQAFRRAITVLENAQRRPASRDAVLKAVEVITQKLCEHCLNSSGGD